MVVQIQREDDDIFLLREQLLQVVDGQRVQHGVEEPPGVAELILRRGLLQFPTWFGFAEHCLEIVAGMQLPLTGTAVVQQLGSSGVARFQKLYEPLPTVPDRLPVQVTQEILRSIIMMPVSQAVPPVPADHMAEGIKVDARIDGVVIPFDDERTRPLCCSVYHDHTSLSIFAIPVFAVIIRRLPACIPRDHLK